MLSVIQNKKAREAVTANGREGSTDTNENVMRGTLVRMLDLKEDTGWGVDTEQVRGSGGL